MHASLLVARFLHTTLELILASAAFPLLQAIDSVPESQVHMTRALEWTKDRGLDPEASEAYDIYVREVGEKYHDFVAGSIEKAGRQRQAMAMNPLASEVIAQTVLCHSKVDSFVGREQTVARLTAGDEAQASIAIIFGYVPSCGL